MFVAMTRAMTEVRLIGSLEWNQQAVERSEFVDALHQFRIGHGECSPVAGFQDLQHNEVANRRWNSQSGRNCLGVREQRC
jgi:hypothetical protein